MQLAGKNAIVTGASRGIGRAAAIALAQAGANVAINYYSHGDEAQQTAEEVRRAGAQALLVQGDVADQAAVEQMVAEAAAQFGRLDIAVSNAAYSDRELFHLADMDGFRRTVNVTMWGAFYLLRAATNQMISQGDGGSIVIVSSPHAYVPAPRAMAYNMAKAAIDHMSRTAAIEVAEHRIRINIVHPGWIDTPGERKFADEETLKAGAQNIPWKRLGQPEEIARGIVYLCDGASDYMTGSAMLIDGGITLPWWAVRGFSIPD